MESPTVSNFPTLTTERFVLRQFNRMDLENVFKGLSHPEVIKYYGISFDTLEATKEQLTWFRDLEQNKTGLWWAICNKDDLTFFGAGGLNDLEKENRKAEVGFWLMPENWGKGIMKEVIPVICNYGFQTLGLHRIEGFVESDNINCKNGLKKLDFDFEGSMRDCEVKNGKFISLDIYAAINRGE
jgi:ribosomal-protein-alanine N-acetyltransferase